MNLIRGHGSGSADVCFIDDIPSNEDITNGIAISGSNERTFNGLLRQFNYSLRQCYRTLLYKHRVVTVDKKKDQEAEYLKTAAEIYQTTGNSIEDILISELKDLQPNIISPIGERTFNLLTGLRSLQKYRGSILELRPDIQAQLKRPIKVIPTFGPQMLNENYTARAYCTIDIGKIVKYADYYKEIRPEGRLWVCRTVEALHNYLNRVKVQDNYLVFDIETIFGIPTCISLCFSDDEAMTVPLQDFDIDRGTLICFWQMVGKILASRIPKVNQNIKYDWSILERFRLPVNNIIGDTVLRAGLIYPELPKNLGFLTSIYTEMPYHKDEGKEMDIKNREKYYLYCAKDSLATRRIYEKQNAELDEFGLRPLYEKKIMPLFFIYKEMDGNGLRVDDEVRQQLLAKYETLLHLHQFALSELAGCQINPRSYPQVSKLIQDVLKYPKRASYDEDTIEEFIGMEEPRFAEGPQILREIICIRKIQKILEYLNTVIHPDGVWRANYNLAGTETGRTSCNSSIDRMFVSELGLIRMAEAGRSLQTISKHGFRIGTEVVGNDLRRMFVPNRGFIFCEIDLSQAEARVDAVLANDFDLLAKFDIAPGIHRITAGWLYNCDPFTIKKDTLEYLHGKVFRHAGERNIGAKRLAQINHLSVRECTRLLDLFHKYSPNVREIYHKSIADFVKSNGFLRTPHGRRRDFFGRVSDHGTINEAVSYYPQAIVADQNKFSFIPVKEKMPSVRYINEAHDSSLVEIRKEQLEPYAQLAKGHLESGIDFRHGSIQRDFELRIPCEIQWSEDNWHKSSMKDLKI